MYTVVFTVLFQLSDREAEVSHHNQQLAALNAELADERERLEKREREEG